MLQIRERRQGKEGMTSMPASVNVQKIIRTLFVLMTVCLLAPTSFAAEPSKAKAADAVGTTTAVRAFATPKAAADALIEAAANFDTDALMQIFGPLGKEIVFSGEPAQDRKHAADFVDKAREKTTISIDPKTGTRAFLLVGNEDWPFPVPLVQRGNKWVFDSNAGKQELLQRRIGSNELDAIEICRGYVEAQNEYAERQRKINDVTQYAQRIIATSGKQDGLAWQNEDGSWSGPIGENIARAIEQGYSNSKAPYHGYFFKILKGQGAEAPLGEMDFVVNGVMIGGFALVAAPAEYRVTGVRTFIVSHDGVVFEKDLGPETLDEFRKMELFNPDRSWTPVPDDEQK